MAFCSNCGNQVNDGIKFCPKCGQAVGGSPQQQVYQQPNAQQQVYQQPNAQQQYQQANVQQQPVKPDSNMILAILSTIFCCLPTGIYAIILANKVDKLYYSGEYDEAEEASNGAKKWSIIGLVLAVVIYIIYAITVFAFGIGM